MKTIYKYELEVYKSTCEHGHSGGLQTITKLFDTLEDVIAFKSSPEYQQWINNNDFPKICQIYTDKITNEVIDPSSPVGEQITIPMARYNYYSERDEWLTALEHAGVDNWEGFDYAKNLLDA